MSKKEKERNKFLMLILTIIILFLSFNLISDFLILEKKEIFTTLIVSKNSGFDLTPGYLGFGSIQINQAASREILIKNNFTKKVKIIIYSKGEIHNFLRASENEFFLKPNEEKKVIFSIYVLKNSELREYNGTINILMKRF